MTGKDSLKDIAYKYIKNNIISAKFKPGDPILEQSIAEALNVSRTPIREALKVLDSEGYVVSYPFQGTIVAKLSLTDVEEISDLRLLLENWALKRSMRYISDEDLERVKQMFEKADQEEDWNAYHEADAALHELLVTKSNSPRASSMLGTLLEQLQWFRNTSIEVTNRHESLEEHMAIIAAIQSRDLPAAERALTSHLIKVKQRFLEANQSAYLY